MEIEVELRGEQAIPQDKYDDCYSSDHDNDSDAEDCQDERSWHLQFGRFFPAYSTHHFLDLIHQYGGSPNRTDYGVSFIWGAG